MLSRTDRGGVGSDENHRMKRSRRGSEDRVRGKKRLASFRRSPAHITECDRAFGGFQFHVHETPSGPQAC